VTICFDKDYRRFGGACCVFLHCRARIIYTELICKIKINVLWDVTPCGQADYHEYGVSYILRNVK
jgi:hypothetical protein